jgi:uncharacterized protein YggE
MRFTIGCVALAVGLACCCAGRAGAQFGGDGISVNGSGELAVRPDAVEMDLSIVGRAELTGDALVKYRDAKKRLSEALDKLGFKDLSTEERGLSIYAGLSPEQQQRMMQGMPQGGGKSQINVSSTMRVSLKNVRDLPPEELLKTVGRMIDVAQDAGVSIGLSPEEIQQRQQFGMYAPQGAAIRFVVTDLAELREKAYELAVADARDRAARLARLNGVKLGPTLSVVETQVAGDTDANGDEVRYNQFGGFFNRPMLGRLSQERPRITSMTLASIPVRVKLSVRFAIEPSGPATAQK